VRVPFADLTVSGRHTACDCFNAWRGPPFGGARRRIDRSIAEDAMLTTRSLSSTLDRMLSLNQALDQAFAASHDGVSRVWVPALDVAERNDAYVVTLDLPGVDPRSVDVSFEQNVLTVRGTKPSTLASSPDAGEMRVYANERVTGAFERAVRMPEFVDGSAIAANCMNGVLEITVPKAKAAQPRKIEVRAAQPRTGPESQVTA
jgi:HSP20 family protein